MSFNFLNNYVRILTSILFEGKVFEAVINSEPTEGCAVAVKDKMYHITSDVMWELYMFRVPKRNFLIHVEFDYEGKRLKTIIFISIKLHDRLFGKLITEQKWRELARMFSALSEKINDFDWPQFVSDYGKGD